MPIDEIGTGVFGAIFRFLGWIFLEVIIEILIKGLAYLICRPFMKIELDSVTALVIGMLAWVVVVFVGFQAWCWFF